MENVVPASPWGPDDQAGAANRLTQDLISQALPIARTGRIFDLSFPVSMHPPTHPPGVPDAVLHLPQSPAMG